MDLKSRIKVELPYYERTKKRRIFRRRILWWRKFCIYKKMRAFFFLFRIENYLFSCK